MNERTSEISNPAQFLELVNAFRISRIILSAAELKLFDHLRDKGTTSDDLAPILGTNPRATDRMLNALVAIGLLSKESNSFINTAFAEKFLVSSSPTYMSGLSLTNHTWKTWSTLTDAAKAGTSLFFDDPINERPEEWQQAFIAAMHRRAGPQAVEVADALDLSNVSRVLDVGGGSGAFTLEFLSRNPDMTGVVFDLPKIVGITERFINQPPTLSPKKEASIQDPASRIQDRVSIVAGDYLKDDFGSGFDLVFMSAIIHINSPEENQLLIKKGVKALNPGGQLVILDHIMNEDRTEPVVGAIFAINMLVGTKHGDTYTGEEIRSWMLDARLGEISLIITPAGIQMMVGKKGRRETLEVRHKTEGT
ncbi:MAG: methyltransferase domain-containing protein [Bacteroidia bacterium]|nr:methyltransferase domain-containing protein [Bacteroidia bacterium]